MDRLPTYNPATSPQLISEARRRTPLRIKAEFYVADVRRIQRNAARQAKTRLPPVPDGVWACIVAHLIRQHDFTKGRYAQLANKLDGARMYVGGLATMPIDRRMLDNTAREFLTVIDRETRVMQRMAAALTMAKARLDAQSRRKLYGPRRHLSKVARSRLGSTS